MGVDTATRDRPDAAGLAALLATCIDEPLAYVDGRRDHDAGPDLRLATDLNDVVADIIFHELAHLLREDADLRAAAVSACRRDGSGPTPATGRPDPAAHEAVVERLYRALAGREELTRALTSVLTTTTERRRDPATGARPTGGPDTPGRPTASAGPPSRGAADRGPDDSPGEPLAVGGPTMRAVTGRAVRGALPTLERLAATAVLGAVVGIVIVVGARYPELGLGALSAGEIFAVAVLAYLPAWLYLRFLRYRAGALWSEYVLHLHRMQFDAPRHLPRPPLNSIYFARWWADGGWVLEQAPSIYQHKFDAYYGRKVSRAGISDDPRVAAETLFPVALASAVMAAGWVLLLGDGRVLTTEEPTRLLDVLGYGFLGAYLYSLQMLMRRFFQSDLKTSAYLGTVVRIITVLVVVSVLWWLPEPDVRGSGGAVIAFVVGFFPLMGLQALHRAASIALRTTVPTLRADYPLSDLDGLNIWYESRLLEEGIEDMQNLVTTNLVDVMLHTRVPLGRLVDWVDQAHLYLHLPRTSRAGERWRYRKVVRAVLDGDAVPPATFDEAVARRMATSPPHIRDLLRACGLRTATDVCRVLGPLADVGNRPPTASERVAIRAEEWIVRSHAPSAGGLRSLVVVLAAEPLLTPILAWRRWEASHPAETAEPAPDPPRPALPGPGTEPFADQPPTPNPTAQEA